MEKKGRWIPVKKKMPVMRGVENTFCPDPEFYFGKRWKTRPSLVGWANHDEDGRTIATFYERDISIKGGKCYARKTV